MAVNTPGLSGIKSPIAYRQLNTSKPVVTNASFGGKTLTIDGSVAVDPTTYKFVQSVRFPGSPSRISSPNSADFRFGTGNFTVEWWMYFTGLWSAQPASSSICGQKLNDSTSGWVIYRDGGYPTKLNFRLGLQNNFPTVTTPTPGVWQHWCVERSGTTVRWYVDGVVDATTTSSYNTNDTSGTFYVGYAQTWGGYFNGYIEELRVSNIARYNGAFTPPTSKFTYDSNTKFLLGSAGPYIFDRTFV